MMRFFALILTVSLCWGIAGCGNDDVSTKTKKVTPKAVTNKVKAKKELKEPEPDKVIERFSYIPEGRRDPFASLLTIREPLSDDEPETPLQRFGLKELKLIAIVLGQNEPRAMVVAPDKKAYTLVVGVKVGRNRGQVVEITGDKIVVEERFRDFSGALRTELKEIALPQGEGE